MAAPPQWTTVPAQDDSGWQLYRPEPPHPAVPTPAPAPTTAQPQPTATPARSANVHRAVAAHPRAARPSIPLVVRPQPAGAALRVISPTSAPGSVSVAVLAALLAAMVCLAFGSIPTSQIRWRRGAAFVADYRLGITSAGAACLLAAAIAFVVTRG